MYDPTLNHTYLPDLHRGIFVISELGAVPFQTLVAVREAASAYADAALCGLGKADLMHLPAVHFWGGE